MVLNRDKVGSNCHEQLPLSSKEKEENRVVAHAVTLALHVRHVAPKLGVRVVLHSDHCSVTLPWLEGLLRADENHYKQYGESLYSSHGLNLSRDPHWEDSLAICEKYFCDRFVPLGLWLEMELAGGLHPTLCTTATPYPWPTQVRKAHEALSQIGDTFSIAVSILTNKTTTLLDTTTPASDAPSILAEYQRLCRQFLPVASPEKQPIFLAVRSSHTSTSPHDITALAHRGVVKLNLVFDEENRVQCAEEIKLEHYCAIMEKFSKSNDENEIVSVNLVEV
jgi:fructose-bisphosphate aldolase class II